VLLLGTWMLSSRAILQNRWSKGLLASRVLNPQQLSPGSFWAMLHRHARDACRAMRPDSEP